jgi:hypothetical protein
MRIRLLVFAVSIQLACAGTEPKGKTSRPQPNKPVPSTSSFVKTADLVPDCNSSREGNLVYIQADEEFQHCSSGTWTTVSITGQIGEQGPIGEVGPAGPSGSTGPQGPPGQSVSILDGSNRRIGLFIQTTDSNPSKFLVRQDDGTIVTFASDTGNPVLLTSSLVILSPYCQYTTADCSGTCYIPTVYRALKNSIIWAGTNRYLRATGTETTSTVNNIVRMFNGACINFTDNMEYYSYTTDYTFPDGNLPPFAPPYFLQ